MFVVLLKFADNKHLAAKHMTEHNQWIQAGFDDGVFALIGSIGTGQGGAIFAHGMTLADLDRRVSSDPFVVHRIVSPEIIEIAPGRTDDRLAFLS